MMITLTGEMIAGTVGGSIFFFLKSEKRCPRCFCDSLFAHFKWTSSLRTFPGTQSVSDRKSFNDHCLIEICEVTSLARVLLFLCTLNRASLQLLRPRTDPQIGSAH
jgi:hypothetical protein